MQPTHRKRDDTNTKGPDLDSVGEQLRKSRWPGPRRCQCEPKWSRLFMIDEKHFSDGGGEGEVVCMEAPGLIKTANLGGVDIFFCDP